MRRGPSKLVTSLAIAGVAVLSACGCEATVSGAPPESALTVVVPQGRMAPLPEVPPDEPAATFGGLTERTKKAMSDAARDGARMSVVVLDRNTGQTVSGGDGAPFPIASVVKLFIADDLLLQEARGETELSRADRSALDVMLRSSDDDAAENFWNRSGGSDIVDRVVARYGLASTTKPYNGKWDLTTSTAADLVSYYDKLLSGGGGLPAEQANVIMANLAQSTPKGIDGYPQRFGIPDAFYNEPVAVKQGWFCCWSGANQLHVSTGVIGPDRRYVMAIGSLDPNSDAVARNDVTEALKTMFPGGRI